MRVFYKLSLFNSQICGFHSNESVVNSNSYLNSNTNMNNFTGASHFSGNDVAASISIASIIITLYAVGLYLHIRIIKISKKTKDMTWKLDITHSILCIGLHTYNVWIHPTTYFVEDLYLYTGEWFCYAAKVVSQYLIIYLGTHSTIIAAMKYVVIVHEEKIRTFKSKVKEAFFVLNFSYPIMSIILSLLLMPNFFVMYGGHSHVERCFGSQKGNYSSMFFLCDLIEHRQDNSVKGVFNTTKWIICKAQVIFSYLTLLNILDVIIYCRTFSFMRK